MAAKQQAHHFYLWEIKHGGGCSPLSKNILVYQEPHVLMCSRRYSLQQLREDILLEIKPSNRMSSREVGGRGREVSDHPSNVLPQNWGGIEPKRTVTSATANDRRTSSPLPR
ncbi:hypothetical protein TNCV_2302841 [Trichonephila clavipes]|nr:hypothetical protein TNCV_2302841 [Trichonephila clavipes]